VGVMGWGNLATLRLFCMMLIVELLSHKIMVAVFGSEGLGQALLCCEEVGLGKTVIARCFIVKKFDE